MPAERFVVLCFISPLKHLNDEFLFKVGGQAAAAEAMLHQLGGEDGLDIGSQLGMDQVWVMEMFWVMMKTMLMFLQGQMMQLLQQMMGGGGQLDASQLMQMGGLGGGGFY